MRARPYDIISLAFLLGILGCTKPPDLPTLSETDPNSPESTARRITLPSSLKAVEVRRLFNAINVNQSLEAFKPLFERASDAELDWLGGWLTRYFYRPSARDSDLAQTLLDATRARRFSALREVVFSWSAEKNYADERRAVFAFLKSPQFPALVSHDIDLLNPDWISIWNRAKALSKARFVEEEVRDLPDPLKNEAAVVTGQELVADLQTLASSAPFRERLTRAISVLDSHYAGTSVLRGLSELSSQYESRAVQGLLLGLRKNLLTHVKGGESVPGVVNQLDLALFFARSANQSSAGLFKALQDRLSGLTVLIAKHPNADFWSSLSSTNGPSPSFKTLTQDIVEILRKFAPIPDSDRPSFQQLPLFLDAIVLAKWFEEQARANPNAFSGDWTASVSPAPLSLSFVDKDGTLKFPQEPLMQALGMQTFAAQFRNYLSQGFAKPEDFHYAIAFAEPSLSLRDAFNSAAYQVLKIQSIGKTEAILQSFLFYFTHPSKENPVSLQNFDSDNLMDSLNRWIGFLSLDDFRRLESFLLDNLKLGSLSTDDRKAILGLFPGDANKARRVMVNNLLISAHALIALDQSIKPGLPTSFEVYRSFAKFTSPPDMIWLSTVLDLLSRSRLFAEKQFRDRPSAALFPSVYQGIQSPALARWLDPLSLVDPDDRPNVFSPFVRMLGNDGLALHLDAFLAVLKDESAGVQSLADKFLSESVDWDLTALPYPVFRAMADNGDAEKLISLVKTYFTVPSLREAAVRLKQMSQNGSLERVFNLLSLVKDDEGRMHGLGLTLGDWLRSGELNALLDSALSLLTPPTPKIGLQP